MRSRQEAGEAAKEIKVKSSKGKRGMGDEMVQPVVSDLGESRRHPRQSHPAACDAQNPYPQALDRCRFRPSRLHRSARWDNRRHVIVSTTHCVHCRLTVSGFDCLQVLKLTAEIGTDTISICRVQRPRHNAI